jgi:hypothetical protein
MKAEEKTRLLDVYYAEGAEQHDQTRFSFKNHGMFHLGRCNLR